MKLITKQIESAIRTLRESYDNMTEAEHAERRAQWIYGQIGLMNRYKDATPEQMNELWQSCREAAGCK